MTKPIPSHRLDFDFDQLLDWEREAVRRWQAIRPEVQGKFAADLPPPGLSQFACARERAALLLESYRWAKGALKRGYLPFFVTYVHKDGHLAGSPTPDVVIQCRRQVQRYCRKLQSPYFAIGAVEATLNSDEELSCPEAWQFHVHMLVFIRCTAESQARDEIEAAFPQGAWPELGIPWAREVRSLRTGGDLARMLRYSTKGLLMKAWVNRKAYRFEGVRRFRCVRLKGARATQLASLLAETSPRERMVLCGLQWAGDRLVRSRRSAERERDSRGERSTVRLMQ